jgi:hypothetical protein
LAPRCLWRESQRGETTCFYATKVRITVRAGEVTSPHGVARTAC